MEKSYNELNLELKGLIVMDSEKTHLIRELKATIGALLQNSESQKQTFDALMKKYEDKSYMADKLAEAIKYYTDVLREVRGEDWAIKPDHVTAKFIEAQNEYNKTKNK